VNRMVKWVLVSTVVMGSMAHAENAPLVVLEGGASPKSEVPSADSADKGTERKLVTVSKFPTGRPKTPPPPPSKSNLPPPKQTPPPTHQTPPPAPPVTHTPPPVTPPPVVPPPVTPPPSSGNLPPPNPPPGPPTSSNNPPPPVGNPPPPPITNLPPPVTNLPPPAPAPEIDARSALSALALLVGGLVVMRGRRSRRLAG
jgi:hypothetical protein